mgnify:CR=1 FL=1
MRRITTYWDIVSHISSLTVILDVFAIYADTYHFAVPDGPTKITPSRTSHNRQRHAALRARHHSFNSFIHGYIPL